MGIPPARRQKVFVATRSLLEPSQLQKLRDVQSVTKFVNEYEATHLDPIIRAYAKSSVIRVILGLNQEGVFTSEDKAKKVFPNLFVKTPKPKPKPQEQLPGKHDPASNTSKPKTKKPKPASTVHEPNALANHPLPAPTQAKESTEKSGSGTVNLPYICQHEILKYTQELLEDCCFEFAEKHIPHILGQQWNCPQAIELPQWSKILEDNFPSISETATRAQDGQELAQMVKRTVRMRNKGVHREVVSVSDIEQMLTSAIDLAHTLRQTEFVSRIQSLKNLFTGSVKEVEAQNKRLEEQRDAIRRRKSRLEEEEANLKGEMAMRENHLIQSLNGVLLSSMTDVHAHNGSQKDKICSDNFWIYGYGALVRT